MSNMAQRGDGTWEQGIPEPFWVGWRLRKARCECGRVFKRTGRKGASARTLYRIHYRAAHLNWRQP